ncbi:MAG: putative rane protein [Verrucomicrobiota bacterium]
MAAKGRTQDDKKTHVQENRALRSLVAGTSAENNQIILMKKQMTLFSRIAVVAVVGGGLCLSVPVYGAEETPKTDAAKKTDTTKKSDTKADKTSPAAPLSDKDKNFMQAAAKGGLMEVEMGKMAQKQGKSADVKSFGSRMVTDHTKANNQLKSLAKKKGVNLDSAAPKMEKMGDATFDKDYMAAMVKDHEKDVGEFEAEAKNGSDPDVKAWASKTLPTLKKHLELAKATQAKLK